MWFSSTRVWAKSISPGTVKQRLPATISRASLRLSVSVCAMSCTLLRRARFNQCHKLLPGGFRNARSRIRAVPGGTVFQTHPTCRIKRYTSGTFHKNVWGLAETTRRATASRTSASWNMPRTAAPRASFSRISSMTTSRLRTSSEAVGSSSSSSGSSVTNPAARRGSMRRRSPPEKVAGGSAHSRSGMASLASSSAARSRAPPRARRAEAAARRRSAARPPAARSAGTG